MLFVVDVDDVKECEREGKKQKAPMKGGFIEKLGMMFWS